MKRLQKAWVFVSHSTRDIREVRRIRDEVELQGGEPLLFFLKCISDTDELDDLLKREIEARRYFLLCDSKAAGTSKWVQEEVAHVKSLAGKRFETLKLGDPWPTQVVVIERLLRSASVFPCYANADRSIVDPLLNSLKREEFGIFDPFGNLPPDRQFDELILAAIDQSSFFLDFLSEASLNSPWCRREASYFLERASREYSTERGPSRYIPVLLEPGLMGRLPVAAREWRSIDLGDGNREAFIRQLSQLVYA